ncbi:MAG: oligosaccharide flippase family protein [Thermoprotei archaeon]
MGLDRGVEEAVSGGLWVFMGNLAVSLAGFFYWIILSRIVGVESVGVASAVVSSASIAVMLVSAGLNYAVIREVAGSGPRSLVASIIMALILGLVGVLIVQPLVAGIGYNWLVVYASSLAFLNILSLIPLSSLIGFEEFKKYSMLTITGSIAKLSVGIVLALLGFGVLSPILGYLAYPLTIVIVGSMLLYDRIRGFFSTSFSDLKSVFLLMISNYPYVFSNQLVIMLSVYLSALVIGKPVSTGILYISFMIITAVAAIPIAILSASLPISTRRNSDPFDEAFRISLALSTPLIVVIASMPRELLGIINPELVSGAPLIELLVLSYAPLVFLSMSITRFNKEKRLGRISLIGITRLLALLLPFPVLVGRLGVIGIALAYLVSTIASSLVAIMFHRNSALLMLIFWCIHALPVTIYYLGLFNELVNTIVMLISAILIMHFSGLFKLEEYTRIARVMLRSISEV